MLKALPLSCATVFGGAGSVSAAADTDFNPGGAAGCVGAAGGAATTGAATAGVVAGTTGAGVLVSGGSGSSTLFIATCTPPFGGVRGSTVLTAGTTDLAGVVVLTTGVTFFTSGGSLT